MMDEDNKKALRKLRASRIRRCTVDARVYPCPARGLMIAGIIGKK
jgi:hypothetical protein